MERAINSVVNCKNDALSLPPDSPALKGVVTESLWKIFFHDLPAPSVEERSQTLVLTFEATDYDRLEWNFCQNKPLWKPSSPDKPCFTNDPNSYITWGPRGATAGNGMEVQWILWQVDKKDRGVIDHYFLDEASEVRKLFGYSKDSARLFLCSIYIDENRRNKWSSFFKLMAAEPLVRNVYDQHYRSNVSDGWKMEVFYNIYRSIGVVPTEVDYGLFLDRATHSTPPKDIAKSVSQIKNWLRKYGLEEKSPNIRRAIASLFKAKNRTDHRLGRDVTYFVDHFGVNGLTKEERDAWVERGRLHASSVGLSDSRAAPDLKLINVYERPNFVDVGLSNDMCAKSVLNPVRPKKP
jgi:hypothetical protein